MATGPSSDTTAPATETESNPQTEAFNEEGDQSSNAVKRWMTEESRSRTKLEQALIETRASRQAGLFKRARAHKYEPVTLVDSRSRVNGPSQLNQESTSSIRDTEQHPQDDTRKQLSRLDLFIDLVWVGIIAKIASTFRELAFSGSQSNLGITVLDFILLFLPIWGIWDGLRVYCINFYTDDIPQRNILIWILVLSVMYGINAPYALSEGGENEGDATSLTLLIAVYLVARASFLLAELAQTVFLPCLWRLFFFKLLTTCLASAFWISAIFVGYPGRLDLLIVANGIEHPIAIFLLSLTADRMLILGFKRVVQIDHYIERYEDFFIIILGEGVYNLIDGSASGKGITSRSGTVVTGLIVYYILQWFYFHGDRTKVYIHALRRTWWRSVLWQMFHLNLFAALLILASTALYLIEHLPGHPSVEDSLPDLSEENLYAMWFASVALAIVLFSMTVIALWNRSMDKAGTLVVNSRWLRLSFRVPVVVLVVCLPLFDRMTPSIWFGIVVVLLWVLFVLEWVAGLERRWRVVEARGNRNGD